jgi:hypothetical protein
MGRNLAQILARMHAEFGIYDGEMFSVPDSRNIIHRISSIPELTYLHRFYINYQREYMTELQKRPHHIPVSRLTNVSRGVDLPFIGESVIQTGRAKYLFVFEGSFSPPDRIAVTVLSCLWPLTGLHPLQDIFRTFWPSTYDHIVDCLGITAEIARHSYVIDAVRIGNPDGKQDHPRNRRLLEREIEQLNPELVVLVGKTAAATIGSKAQREHESLYIKVPFPTKRLPRRLVEIANQKYEELRNRWPHNR